MSIGLLSLIIYWPVQDFGFLNYDDQLYVTENTRTQGGLTLQNIINAFTDAPTGGNWHPITIISHMVDWHLFRLNAGGHHWTNVIIHIFNTILLFFLMNQMTGAIWRSALVSALFAAHPVNVESVAWIAERKNVLSTFFWLLTMILYVYYVKSPNWKRYSTMLGCFLLGLMTKSMLVTLPCVLLLMDYWPLKRTKLIVSNDTKENEIYRVGYAKQSILYLLLEKMPLLAASAVFSILTLTSQFKADAMIDLHTFPFVYRLGNAILSYGLYIKNLLLPYGLAAFYPFSYYIPVWSIALSASLILVISVFITLKYRKAPYLVVGWLWFLGTMVPVIGLIQVGSQAMADRYAYVPYIGLFLMLVWGGFEVLRNRFSTRTIAVAAILCVIALAFVSHRQVFFWKDTLTLFSRALDVTENNAFAHSNVAGALILKNDIDKALYHCEKAISLNPDDYNTLIRIARIYSLKGRNDEAISALSKAIRIGPDRVRAYDDLYFLLMQKGEAKRALQVYAKAVEVVKDNPDIYYHYGTALARQGYYDDSLIHYRKALHLRPEHVDIIINVGIVLMILGKNDDAIYYFKKALEINPQHATAHYQLSVVLEKKGLVDEAYQHYQQAVRLNPAFKK